MDVPSSWVAATEAACAYLSEVGARERRRHGRTYAAWCAQRGLDPLHAGRGDLEDYLGGLPGNDPQRTTKARCALRAILEVTDADLAARAAGLGIRGDFPDPSTPLGRLAAATVDAAPGRSAIRRSLLGHLFSWCREVDLDPARMLPSDVTQYRRWLVEVGAEVGESVVVANDFLELRYSARGRRLLGEPDPMAVPIRISREPDLLARFDLAAFGLLDPLGVGPGWR